MKIEFHEGNGRPHFLLDHEGFKTLKKASMAEANALLHPCPWGTEVFVNDCPCKAVS